jgi:hypothetical protein
MRERGIDRTIATLWGQESHGSVRGYSISSVSDIAVAPGPHSRWLDKISKPMILLATGFVHRHAVSGV